jgi:hypothetical protein
VHLIVGERGKLIRFLVISGFVARNEILPQRIDAIGIVRVNGLESFGRWASQFDKFIADCAMAAEDALLHA